MDLGVMHSMEESTNANDPEYKTGTFIKVSFCKQQRLDNDFVDAINLKGSNSWRAGQTTTSEYLVGKNDWIIYDR